MNVAEIFRILAARRELRGHERWTRESLLAHQQRALANLRQFALRKSPFYARTHRGVENAPLSALPILTKRMMMEHYDEIVTDPRIKLDDVKKHLDALRDDERFLGRYWVSSTSGSSGLKSIIPSDPAEWATIIGSYGRANEWAGIRLSPFRRASMAVVSSRTPFHQSARVSRTVEMPLLDAQRIDASDSLQSIIDKLNAQQPQILIAYASMIRALAEEQLAGPLRLKPRVVNCSSEVLTSEARARAKLAWGVEPFNVYAATETGGIAAECAEHHGMHTCEDLVIAEPVDNDYMPVPPGTTAARLLVTVLHSRTLPLIRYELTDSVRVATEPCTCGLPFRLIQSIEGRSDDVLELPGNDAAPVQVHPKVFMNALDTLHAEAWQVRQESDGLRVLVSKPESMVAPATIRDAIASQLAAARVTSIPITVEIVDSIAPGASGKRPLVVARKAASA